jgi:hypothetical protein
MATSAPCEHCGTRFNGTNQLDAESKRIDHEADCSENPANQ